MELEVFNIPDSVAVPDYMNFVDMVGVEVITASAATSGDIIGEERLFLPY